MTPPTELTPETLRALARRKNWDKNLDHGRRLKPGVTLQILWDWLDAHADAWAEQIYDLSAERWDDFSKDDPQSWPPYVHEWLRKQLAQQTARAEALEKAARIHVGAMLVHMGNTPGPIEVMETFENLRTALAAAGDPKDA
jgi:hypothetical protein